MNIVSYQVWFSEFKHAIKYSVFFFFLTILTNISTMICELVQINIYVYFKK